MARSRLGVAIILPEPARTEVQALRRALGCPSLETQPPHITLVPPVNVRAEHIADVMAVARSAAASVDGPLRLRLGPRWLGQDDRNTEPYACHVRLLGPFGTPPEGTRTAGDSSE